MSNKRNVVAEISIIPVGTETPSISKYVAKALSVLENEKDIKYELTAMGTIIEGKLDKVLNLAKKMHKSVLSKEIKRVVTTIKIDDRTDKELTMKGKVEVVNKLLKK